jgi:hypothetical protein
MSTPSQLEITEIRKSENDIAVASMARSTELAADTESRPNSTGGSLRYLELSELSAWDALVDISPQGSPLSRSWWLKAVCGMVRILGYFKDERLIAGLPLYFEKRFGITACTMPKLTQTLGPIMSPSSARPVTAAWEEMEILGAFAKELSKHYILFQAFHPSVQNWSPFYWEGFKQTCRATQVIDLRAPDKIWDNMAKMARRNVRKAQHSGVMVKPCGPEELWQAEEKTFRRQNMKVPHSVEYLSRLYDSAKENQAGECFAAVDSQERVHGVVFMIWDKKRAIGVASGGDPELRTSGAMSLLMWHGIQFAAERSEMFDFGGSMLQPVELFQRSFGTSQLPYMWIMKFPLWLKIYLTVRHKL